jgi:hypothetical protein
MIMAFAGRNMKSAEIKKIAKAWVAYTHAFNTNENTELEIWASDKMWDLADDEPELCWLVIQEVLKQDSSTTILENLSAGPLEDLLSKHCDGPHPLDGSLMGLSSEPGKLFLLL